MFCIKCKSVKLAFSAISTEQIFLNIHDGRMGGCVQLFIVRHLSVSVGIIVSYRMVDNGLIRENSWRHEFNCSIGISEFNNSTRGFTIL